MCEPCVLVCLAGKNQLHTHCDSLRIFCSYETRRRVAFAKICVAGTLAPDGIPLFGRRLGPPVFDHLRDGHAPGALAKEKAMNGKRSVCNLTRIVWNGKPLRDSCPLKLTQKAGDPFFLCPGENSRMSKTCRRGTRCTMNLNRFHRPDARTSNRRGRVGLEARLCPARES